MKLSKYMFPILLVAVAACTTKHTETETDYVTPTPRARLHRKSRVPHDVTDLSACKGPALNATIIGDWKQVFEDEVGLRMTYTYTLSRKMPFRAD